MGSILTEKWILGREWWIITCVL